jgi:hypothetical protein
MTLHRRRWVDRTHFETGGEQVGSRDPGMTVLGTIRSEIESEPLVERADGGDHLHTLCRIISALQCRGGHIWHRI